MPRHAPARVVMVAVVLYAALPLAAREIATPWASSLRCSDAENACSSPDRRVLYRGSPQSMMLLTNTTCAVPRRGPLLFYVLLQTVLTALWGAISVGLERLIKRWRTRPRSWNAAGRTRALGRPRARTRYDAEKEEVFYETRKGTVAPALNLERLASYTSDLPDVADAAMPSSSRVPIHRCPAGEFEYPTECPLAESPRRQLALDLLTTITTVKFGLSLRTAIAALPTVVQLAIGLYLRLRPGGACPHRPQIAGWFGLFGGQSTVPTQIVVSLLAMHPTRFFAPVAALFATGSQIVWSAGLMMSLFAVAFPSETAAICLPLRAFRIGRTLSWTVSSVLFELVTASAATMFAMHIRPRADLHAVPVSLGGLTLICVVLLALQFARAAVVATIFPSGSDLGASLRCAVDAGAQDGVYAFGRFINLF